MSVEGVLINPLKSIPDDRGAVMHMLRADAPHFQGFGEVYFSQVKFGKVKAWKRHKRMVQNFAVPFGNLRVVIYDDREHSPTRGNLQELTIGESNYQLLTIPAGVWYGFQAVGKGDALICNCASLMHDPTESERAEVHSDQVPFTWN